MYAFHRASWMLSPLLPPALCRTTVSKFETIRTMIWVQWTGRLRHWAVRQAIRKPTSPWPLVENRSTYGPWGTLFGPCSLSSTWITMVLVPQTLPCSRQWSSMPRRPMERWLMWPAHSPTSSYGTVRGFTSNAAFSASFWLRELWDAGMETGALVSAVWYLVSWRTYILSCE